MSNVCAQGRVEPQVSHFLPSPFSGQLTDNVFITIVKGSRLVVKELTDGKPGFGQLVGRSPSAELGWGCEGLGTSLQPGYGGPLPGSHSERISPDLEWLL